MLSNGFFFKKKNKQTTKQETKFKAGKVNQSFIIKKIIKI